MSEYSSPVGKMLGKIAGTYDGDVPEPSNELEAGLNDILTNGSGSGSGGGGNASLVLIAAVTAPGSDPVLCKTGKGPRLSNRINTLRVATDTISVSEFFYAIQNGATISFIECKDQGSLSAYAFEGMFFNDRNGTFQVSFYGINNNNAIVKRVFNSTTDGETFVEYTENQS